MTFQSKGGLIHLRTLVCHFRHHTAARVWAKLIQGLKLVHRHMVDLYVQKVGKLFIFMERESGSSVL